MSLGPVALIIALILAVIGIVAYQYRSIFSFVRYRQALRTLEFSRSWRHLLEWRRPPLWSWFSLSWSSVDERAVRPLSGIIHGQSLSSFVGSVPAMQDHPD